MKQGLFVGTGGRNTRRDIDGEPDPFGRQKDAAEFRIRDALLQFWQGQLERIKKKLAPGIPKSRKAIEDLPKRLDRDFWSAEDRELLAVLLPWLTDITEDGIEQFIEEAEATYGLGVDWSLVNADAARWARQHGGWLAKGINKTTKKQVGAHVANWIETPGENMGDLFERLAKLPGFGPKRAEMVGSTEVTDAYARGNRWGAQAYEDAGLFQWVRTWKTNRDDIVCDLCRPLHKKTAKGTTGHYPEGGGWGPSRHPRCRCWEVYAPVVGEVEEAAGASQLDYRPSAAQLEKVQAYVNNKVAGYAREMDVPPKQIVTETLDRLRDDLAYPMSIRSGQIGAEAILTDGRFKTQFETGASGGLFDVEFRSRSERAGLGIPEHVDLTQRPVYGYVKAGSPKVSQYGGVEFELKESVKERATYTLGDSLGRFDLGTAVGSPISDPDLLGCDGLIDLYHEYGARQVPYIEAQIQGGVSVSDVARIIVHSDSPEYNWVISEARRQGIEVVVSADYL